MSPIARANAATSGDLGGPRGECLNAAQGSGSQPWEVDQNRALSGLTFSDSMMVTACQRGEGRKSA